MTKHTPGPWSVSGVRVRESGQRVLQIYGADDKVYALVLYSDMTPAEHVAAHADARLIAAAPDMLSALNDFVGMFSGSVPAGSIGDEVLQAARAAIAKAEGRP